MHIHSDVQFEISNEPDFTRPHIYISLRQHAPEELLRIITITLQEETLIQFTISNVGLNHFKRNTENKVKIVVTK